MEAKVKVIGCVVVVVVVVVVVAAAGDSTVTSQTVDEVLAVFGLGHVESELLPTVAAVVVVVIVVGVVGAVVILGNILQTPGAALPFRRVQDVCQGVLVPDSPPGCWTSL